MEKECHNSWKRGTTYKEMKNFLTSPQLFILLVLKQPSMATKSKTSSKLIKSIYLNHLLLLLVAMSPISQATQSCISSFPNGCH